MSLTIKLIQKMVSGMIQLIMKVETWDIDQELKGGYFPVAPIDNGVDLRAEMMLVLEQVGLEVVLGHHEVAQGQHEIGIVFGDLIEAADNVQKIKICY